LILWISYSLLSLPDAHRSAERSEPRKQRGGLLGALPQVAGGRVAGVDHHQNLAESGRDRRLGCCQRDGFLPDSNAPMLAINTRLGFKPAWAESTWELGIADARRYVRSE
jgi:hypothetical protein